MVLDVLSWIVCGLIIGMIARAVLPGRQGLGLMMTVILGIVGAFVGGLIATLILGIPATDEADVNRMWPGWIFAILGATLVLWIFTALSSEGEEPTPSLR